MLNKLFTHAFGFASLQTWFQKKKKNHLQPPQFPSDGNELKSFIIRQKMKLQHFKSKKLKGSSFSHTSMNIRRFGPSLLMLNRILFGGFELFFRQNKQFEDVHLPYGKP